VSASLDGSEEIVVWSREPAEPYSDAEPYSELFGYSLICFTADGAGNLFTVSRYAYPDENDPNMPAYRDELTKTSPDGAELYTIDLSKLLDADETLSRDAHAAARSILREFIDGGQYKEV
jgi:hypothetical protein